MRARDARTTGDGLTGVRARDAWTADDAVVERGRGAEQSGIPPRIDEPF